MSGDGPNVSTASALPDGAVPPPTERVRVRRKPDRGHYDRETIDAILDAAVIGHVGWVLDGQPLVTPTNIWRSGDRLYWHGSAASRMLRETADGASVCITATIVDGLVLARSGTDHSINYRSAMVIGKANLVTDPAEKLLALEALVEHLYPGRWAELRPATAKEVKATTILWTDLDEASAKIRVGGPHDEPGDEKWPAWAGVVPVATVTRAPVGDEFVPGDLPVPTYLPRDGDGFGVR